MKTSKLREIIRDTIKESMDDRLKKAMGTSGFSDEEQDDFFSKDTPSTKGISGYQKATNLISTLRQDYRNMSDDELDEFSKEMVNHFLDNTAGAATAKINFGKRGL